MPVKLKNKLKVLEVSNVGMTQFEIAKAAKLSRQTVTRVLSDEDFKELRNEQRKVMVQGINNVATDKLTEIHQTPAKSLGEAAVAFGILIDKQRALAGEDAKGNTYNIGDNRSLNFNVSTNLGKVVEKNKT